MPEATKNGKFAHTDKNPGDLILSAHWNASMREVERLETDKVNRQGADTIHGPLTIEAALTINSSVGIGTNAIPTEKLEVNGNIKATNATLTGTLAVTSTSTLTGNVGIGRSPGQALHVAANKSVRFELGTSQNLSLGGNGSFEIDAPNVASGRFIVTNAGNVGIGTTSPDSKLHIDKGRVDMTASDATGGGQNRFNGLLSHTEGSHKRSQLVVSSGYSDLVIASCQANNIHGSTLTFVTSNPTNTAQYRKWVINQGNWGNRKQFLEFGYSDTDGITNPHNCINDAATALTLDGVNKRVGIGTRIPSEKLEVSGNIKAVNATFIGINIAGIFVTIITPDYRIDSQGSALESSEGNTNDVKINGTSIITSTLRRRGVNTVILKPDGTIRASQNHDIYGDATTQWNSWATWVNSTAIDDDAVAVTSNDAIGPSPATGAAATLLRSIGATRPFVSTFSYRRSYALLFLKGKKSSAIESFSNQGEANAKISSSYYEIGGSKGNVGIGTNTPEAKLDVQGHILEKLDLINCNDRGDWTAQNHPIMQYFKAKLTGKPVGTMMRAIQDHPSWRGHYWQGWVDADSKIRVIHNQINTTHVVT